MNTVTSQDGTPIAFDRVGSGPAVILVSGAFSYRKFPGLVPLIEILSREFSVINYDRRGRGDSGDTPPYSMKREIEDLQALIEEAGGSAYVWGNSSGAVLALEAAASGLNITKLALYEPPFNVDGSGAVPPVNFQAQLSTLVETNQRGEAVKYFMTKVMGAPGFVIPIMRMMPRVWGRLKAVAHTLPYDAALVADHLKGDPVQLEKYRSVSAPTIVISGAKSGPGLQAGARAAADIVPNARHHSLAGQNHNVSMKVLAPVLCDFFGA